MPDIKQMPCPKCEGFGHISITTENSASAYQCKECSGTGLVEVPMTNADRIRAMSDKKLAHWINLYGDKDFAYEHCCDAEWRKKPCNNKCVACLVAWLQQPAEEVDHE